MVEVKEKTVAELKAELDAFASFPSDFERPSQQPKENIVEKSVESPKIPVVVVQKQESAPVQSVPPVQAQPAEAQQPATPMPAQNPTSPTQSEAAASPVFSFDRAIESVLSTKQKAIDDDAAMKKQKVVDDFYSKLGKFIDAIASDAPLPAQAAPAQPIVQPPIVEPAREVPKPLKQSSAKVPKPKRVWTMKAVAALAIVSFLGALIVVITLTALLGH
jgi:hypothetical protein